MKCIILEDGKTMVNGVVYKNGMLKTGGKNNLYYKDKQLRGEYLVKAVNKEYIKLIQDWKPKMYSPKHIRIVDIIKLINKNEKRKQNNKIIDKTIELKKTVIWLLNNN